MNNESRKTLNAVRALALKDLETTSDEEIRAEFASEGIDPDKLAASIAVSLDEVLAASLRQQATAAKVIMQVRTASKKSLRLTQEQIKERIAQAFAAEPQLTTAFREGSRRHLSAFAGELEQAVLVNLSLDACGQVKRLPRLEALDVFEHVP